MSAPAILDLTREIPSGVVARHTIGIAAGLEPRDVMALNVECGLDHIVQQDGLLFEIELRIAQEMIAKPREFIEHPFASVFGVPSLTPALCIQGKAEIKKRSVLGQFADYLQDVDGVRAVREEAMMIADELYTNGSKNAAPLVGKHDPATVKPGWVKFMAHADKDRLVVGCVDSYGALDVTMITSRVLGCFRNGVADSINETGAGAGIGGFMVFNSCSSLYIAVEKGQRTVVMCTLPMHMRNKTLLDLPKHFHALAIS